MSGTRRITGIETVDELKDILEKWASSDKLESIELRCTDDTPYSPMTIFRFEMDDAGSGTNVREVKVVENRQWRNMSDNYTSSMQFVADTLESRKIPYVSQNQSVSSVRIYGRPNMDMLTLREPMIIPSFGLMIIGNLAPHDLLRIVEYISSLIRDNEHVTNVTCKIMQDVSIEIASDLVDVGHKLEMMVGNLVMTRESPREKGIMLKILMCNMSFKKVIIEKDVPEDGIDFLVDGFVDIDALFGNNVTMTIGYDKIYVTERCDIPHHTFEYYKSGVTSPKLLATFSTECRIIHRDLKSLHIESIRSSEDGKSQLPIILDDHKYLVGPSLECLRISCDDPPGKTTRTKLVVAEVAKRLSRPLEKISIFRMAWYTMDTRDLRGLSELLTPLGRTFAKELHVGIIPFFKSAMHTAPGTFGPLINVDINPMTSFLVVSSLIGEGTPLGKAMKVKAYITTANSVDMVEI